MYSEHPRRRREDRILCRSLEAEQIQDVVEEALAVDNRCRVQLDRKTRMLARDRN